MWLAGYIKCYIVLPKRILLSSDSLSDEIELSCLTFGHCCLTGHIRVQHWWLSCCSGQVELLSGQVNFISYLSDGQAHFLWHPHAIQYNIHFLWWRTSSVLQKFWGMSDKVSRVILVHAGHFDTMQATGVPHNEAPYKNLASHIKMACGTFQEFMLHYYTPAVKSTNHNYTLFCGVFRW